MMPNELNKFETKQRSKAFMIVSFVFILFLTDNVYAVPTLDQVIANISNNIGALMQMVTGLAYILGFYYVIVGVMELKHFGEARTMMSSEHGLKKPLIHIFVGAALIYLPTSIKTGIETLWQQPSPLAYVVEKGNAWSELVGNSFMILQFIGVIAFIRGLIKLSHLGGHGGQPGQFGSAMTHIIGGILCINMYDTVKMVLATLGMDTTIAF